MQFRPTLLCFVVIAASVAVQAQSAANNDVKIARGKYLVERVSTCQDCHTPRNRKGEFIKEQWLQGAPLFIKPVAPIPDWTGAAPPIAGLNGWADEDAIKFFMTGKKPTGDMARAPMPQFRFNRRDAEAVVAYLKSLNKEQATAAKK